MYRKPDLNDQCYFNNAQLSEIPEDIKQYINCKTLYLNNNSIQNIDILSSLPQIEQLYLQNNCIRTLNLQNLQNLQILNINDNFITQIQINESDKIQTIYADNNKLSNINSLNFLLNLQNLTTLSLQNNQIEDENIFNLICQIKSLKTLYLQQNDIQKTIQNYRRKLIFSLPNLTYLDSFPVTQEERSLTEIYFNQGPEEMKKQIKIFQIKKEAENEKLIAMNSAFLNGKSKDECILIGKQVYQEFFDQRIKQSENDEKSDEIPEIEKIDLN